LKPLALKLIERLEAQERRLAKLERLPAKPVALSAERLLADRLEGHAGHNAVMERERVLHRALDEEYLTRELAPGRVLYEAGGLDAINANAGVMRLPATLVTVNPMVHSQVGMNSLWPRTRPRLNIWYTSTVGAVAAFNLRFQARLYAVGGTTAPAVLFSTILTPPGPAVANTVLFATALAGAVIPSIPAPLRFAVVRIGGDANANDLDILLAKVVFEESA
jgi:hypothetical protein